MAECLPDDVYITSCELHVTGYELEDFRGRGTEFPAHTLIKYHDF